MKLLLSASCPTNEYLEGDVFYLDLTDAARAELQRMRASAVAYLASEKAIFGHVTLPDDKIRHQVLFDHQGLLHNILDFNDSMPAPDDFKVEDYEEVRTELHSIKIFTDGDIWLEALSKHSADFFEAQLPNEMLDPIPPIPRSEVRTPHL